MRARGGRREGGVVAGDYGFGIRLTFDGKEVEAGAKRASEQLREIGDAARAAAAGAKSVGSPFDILMNSAPAATKVAATSLDSVGLSAKQTAAALRGVPAQFTDIFTSLQAGQAPLQVILQQGGQLKDMFGGVAPAAKALGGYVASLVTPLTVSLAAAGALAVAMAKGSDEASQLERSVILTGNAARTSAGKLQDMAAALAGATSSTQGAASDALAQLAGNGKVAEGSLRGAAEAALSLERATGQSIADSVKQFAELGKSPVEASLKLNEQFRYLTAEVYRQIKAAEDLGRTDEAAAIAQKAYADAMIERGAKIEQSLGLVEKVWNTLGGAAKNAWDLMLNVGREDSLETQLKKAQDQLQNGFAWWNTIAGTAQKVDYLKERVAQEKASADASAEHTRNEQAGIAFAQLFNQHIGKRAQQQKELAEAQSKYSAATALAAGDQARQVALAAQYRTVVDGINQKYKEGPASGSGAYQAAKAQVEGLVDAAKDGAAEQLSALKAMQSSGLISWADYYRQANAIAQQGLQQQVEAYAQGYGAAQKRGDNGEMQGWANKMANAGREMQKADADAEMAIEADRQKRILDIVSQTSDGKLAILQKQMVEASALFQEGAITEQQWLEYSQQQVGKFADKSSEKIAGVELAITNAFAGMGDAVADFVLTGKLNFSNMVEAMIRDIIRLEVQAQATSVWKSLGGLSGIAGSIGSWFSGSSSAAPAADPSVYTANGYAWAKGGVFEHSPSLSAYSGGVYDRPTPFLFAKGAAGIFGEAGPEAIMPLKRGSDGKLGVVAQVGGGGANVEVHIHESSAKAGQVNSSQDAGGKTIIDIFVEKVKNAMSADVASGGSFASTLESQYALNRAAGAWR